MFTSQISRDEVRSAIEDKLCAHFAVTAKTATDDQVFQASAIVIREIMSRLLAVEETRCPDREVHYLSMEFLMGRSLMKNAFNLGIANALTGALEDLGRNASDIFEAENDAGLGNGGLGRLAACYMDSLATLGIPATGYSLCYELGIFRQKIVDGKQTEVADDWRSAAESWLVFQGKKPHNKRTVARSCSRRSAAQERNTPFRKRGGRSRQGDIRRSGKCRSAQLRGDKPPDKRRRKACHKRLGGSQ